MPFPVTKEVLERGRERFNINCTPCHGRVGDGDGFIPTRGFRRPPSFHIERLRKVPIGYFFDVDDQWLRRHARYARADCAARSLVHRGLHPRAAIESECDFGRYSCGTKSSVASAAVPRYRQRGHAAEKPRATARRRRGAQMTTATMNKSDLMAPPVAQTIQSGRC